MKAIKSIELRDNLKKYCDEVYKGETLVISRKRNENVVMLSETEYNALVKSRNNEAYLSMLHKSYDEIQTGGFVTKSISELE